MKSNESSNKKSILLIEPDQSLANIISSELSDRYSVHIVQTAEDAIHAADENKPDCVVTEIKLADHSAAGFLYEFRSYVEWQSIPIIVYTSQRIPDAITTSRDWRLLGISEMLYKPSSSLEELVHSVDQVIQQST